MFPIYSSSNQHSLPIARQTQVPGGDFSTAPRSGLTVSRSLAEGLRSLGVQTALGIGGAAIARFTSDCHQSGINVIPTRNEAGAAYIACEQSIAQNRPVVVYVTTGPGLANAIVGLISAAWEGGRIIAVVGGTPSHRLGRGAFQETGPAVLNLDPWLPAGLTHRVDAITGQASLQSSLTSIAYGNQRPDGFLNLLLLPMQTQLKRIDYPVTYAPRRYCSAPSLSDIDTACTKLKGRRVVVWLGAGAIGAEQPIEQFIQQTGSVVTCSPRGKGVFPEDHPQSINVLGFAAQPGAKELYSSTKADIMLVLGSRLGEFATGWDESLVPKEGLIHVDVNEQSMFSAFPHAKVTPVRSAIRPFMEELVRREIETVRITLKPSPQRSTVTTSPSLANGPLHPMALMASIQRIVVDRSDALIMAEAGNAFAWATHVLRFSSPRFRVSTSFGAMGHATCGVVGLAIGSNRPALALVGDGAMLMHSELTTAKALNTHAIWVVLDDQSFGMVRHGMQAIGLRPVGTTLPRVDFVALAQAQGVVARRVDHAGQLDDALVWALSEKRPCVISVRVNADIAPPFGARNKELTRTHSKRPACQPPVLSSNTSDQQE